MANRLTGFSKLIITLVVLVGAWIIINITLKDPNVEQKIHYNLENKGFHNIVIEGNCSMFSYCVANSNNCTKIGYAFTAVSNTSKQVVAGCACVNLFTSSITYEWY